MAQMYPDRVAAGSPESERVAFSAFRRLPEEWRCFHRVVWQSRDEGVSGDGEADFVLLHPRYGLLVIEVKGGGVSLDRGVWRSEDRDGRVHEVADPFQQARDSKHALLKYLRRVDPRLPFLSLSHAVVLPDVNVSGDLGPGAPHSMIIDQARLRDLESTLIEIVGDAGSRPPMSPGLLDRITDAIAPVRAVRPLLADAVAAANARLVLLTDEQVRVLQQMRRNWRAIIYGGAGTGKTVLAVQRARMLAADGFSVLLTCFNRPLADHLAGQVADVAAIKVMSFHQLCWRAAKDAGLPVPDAAGDQQLSHQWYEDSGPNLLPDAFRGRGSFDAVVVDEGQDFAPNWWDALQLITNDPDNSPFYVFADSHQAYRRPDWRIPFVAAEFELSINCRNTVPIAERVGAVYGDGMEVLGAQGPLPVYLELPPKDDSEDLVAREVSRLIGEGLRPKQLVVLGVSRSWVERLRGSSFAGTRLVGLGEQGVVVETIQRYKGLEADAVIVVLPALEALAGDELDAARALAYVALSRPKSLLVAIGSAATRRLIGWGSPGGT